jgi:predicted phage gp36 major capsid-like protein
LNSFLLETVSKEFAFQTNETLINGDGAGRPLGVVAAPGTITIAKDAGQATKTLSFTNLQNMWTQSHGASRANMVWYAQEDIDIDNVALPVAPSTAWAPPVGAPSFKGRPFLPLENCQAIGTTGDVVLGDWSQYLLLLGGMRNAVSMHFKFDYYESYARFIWRCDGMPLWETPLTPIHSTTTKAPFLVLATR